MNENLGTAAVGAPARAVIAVRGDELRCLAGIDVSTAPHEKGPDVLIVGLDARDVGTRAEFSNMLHRQKDAILAFPALVPQIVAVIDHSGAEEPWMHMAVHRWALSLHRRFQRARGSDTVVTALLIDPSASPELVARRLEELAERAPGVNPVAVLCAREIEARSITEASTNDFI